MSADEECQSEKQPLVRKRRGRPQWALTLFCIVLALVPCAYFLRSPRRDESPSWRPCGQFECTSVSVPYTYDDDTDARRASIALARVPATHDKLGSIFINPGGPDDGILLLENIGRNLSALVDGRYDIVGFDPRGVNNSRPAVKCFDNALEATLYASSGPALLDAPVRNVTAFSDDIRHQVRRTDASVKEVYRQCHDKTGDILPFLGTANVVRDLDLISKVLNGPDGRVNFIGISYGTVIGQYLTAILPASRVGKVMIDGVVSMDEWQSPAFDSKRLLIGLQDTEKALHAFADTCAVAGRQCPLSRYGSAEAIIAALDDILDQTYGNPPAVPGRPIEGFLVRSRVARRALKTGLYGIKGWPKMASAFDQALSGNFTTLMESGVPPVSLTDLAKKDLPDGIQWPEAAIRYADARPYGKKIPTPEDIADFYLQTLSTSHPHSADTFQYLSFGHHWPVESQSRFEGSFNLTGTSLDTPVLILSNELDNVTPLRNAFEALHNYGPQNARLVKQKGGIGHAAASQHSDCTARIVHDYFVRGNVPHSRQTTCQVDELPWQDEQKAGTTAAEPAARAWYEIGQRMSEHLQSMAM